MTAPGDKFPGEMIELLRASRSVAVLTGAGISRQAQTGLWAQFDPLQLATPGAFHKDPKLVWDWYSWRRELISESQPSPGHLALVDLENHYPEFTLVTQNVDGLHQMAGSTAVIELYATFFARNARGKTS